MYTSANKAGERIADVHVDNDRIQVDLVDGRTITAPIRWYPRLCAASQAERDNWQIAGGGFGIHWPDIDEDLSVEGLLSGAAAPSD
jgi:hypothetical protein